MIAIGRITAWMSDNGFLINRVDLPLHTFTYTSSEVDSPAWTVCCLYKCNVVQGPEMERSSRYEELN